MSLTRTLIGTLGGLTVAASLSLAPASAAAASPLTPAYPRPTASASTSINPQVNVTTGAKPTAHPSPAPANGNDSPVETMTLQPSNLYTSYHWYEADNDGPPYCGTHTNGTGPEEAGPGEILAGYFRYWDPGTQPFPCWEQLDQVYRGAVKFDFTSWYHDLIEPAKFMITAKLRFDVTFEDASNGWPTGCPSPIDVLQATTDWTGGTPDLVPGDELYNVPITDQHTNEIDVSSTVRRWMAYDDAGDNGFVLADLADESYPQQNVTCVAHAHNFSLVLQYVPTGR